MNEIHSFADFADITTAMDGVKKRIDETLNRPIIVRAYKIMPSKKSNGAMYLELQFEMDGEMCILFTGSSVLSDQCEKYADKMPFRTIIKKVDKFFTFS